MQTIHYDKSFVHSTLVIATLASEVFIGRQSTRDQEILSLKSSVQFETKFYALMTSNTYQILYDESITKKANNGLFQPFYLEMS